MNKYQKFVNHFGRNLKNGQLQLNEPLSLHTTFKIGGPAKLFFEVRRTEEIVNAISLAKRLQIPYLVIGGGSNILISDSGFNGLVLKNKLRQIKILAAQLEKRQNDLLEEAIQDLLKKYQRKADP